MDYHQHHAVTAKIKLTLYTEERFFGPGICELLERIQGTGSIQAAAAEMKMSYTKAWKIVKRAEREMGVNLIARVSGGKKGGGSTLTEAGERAGGEDRRRRICRGRRRELCGFLLHPSGEELPRMETARL